MPAQIYPEAKDTTTSASKTETKMGTKKMMEEEDDDMRDPRSGRLRKSTYTVSTPTMSSLGQVQGKLEVRGLCSFFIANNPVFRNHTHPWQPS